MVKFVCGNCGSVTVVNEPTFNSVVQSDNLAMKTVNLVPDVVKNNNIKEKHMSKTAERIEKLKAAGFDVTKFKSKFGDVDLNTMLTQCFNDDPIAEEIIKNGYVRNTKLHRRWIMAQTMRLLSTDMDWTKRMNMCYGFDYQFKMMLEELRVLTILEKEDRETFKERAHFFTKDVVVSTVRTYLNKFKKMVGNAKVKKNKKYGEYITLFGKHYQLSGSCLKTLFDTIEDHIYKIGAASGTEELYNALREFMKSDVYHKLHWDTNKSQVWVDAFKGAGCYYTLKNMIMYHNCVIYDKENKPMDQSCSMKYLEKCLDTYKGQYWRMLALLKKVIKDNKFSWRETLERIYADK